eukprot:TRINITY_DN1020_c1_g4_i1.p1 TRINITY_DN1020_c1_g4~~TRINITY_DN1020_c1_g4_i1.p1  ORF type:complete len:1278 (-),score=381.80 TRINITY_DN1020_c1_g4_i1:98-3931(-)
MATIEERLAVLDSFVLEDEQPNIEAGSHALNFKSYSTHNFKDRNAFEAQQHWTVELSHMQKLTDILEHGEYFVHMVYTYRSCSKCLPQVKTADDPNKGAIYEKTFEVLEPEIKKLKEFNLFQRDTVKVFVEHCKRLAQSDKKGATMQLSSNDFVWMLIQILDMLAILDALKNMKACLNNDFSFYKRAFGFLRKGAAAAEDQTQENHSLYLFLANQNSITTALKTELQQIDGFDAVLSTLVNECATRVEKNHFVTPRDKHCLLRVMPFCLFLIDSANNENLNIFASKTIKIQRFAKLFKRYPVVPLYGDMQITLEVLVKASPHFDENVWGKPTEGVDERVKREYEIVNHMDGIRRAHDQYVARFANMLNEIKVSTGSGTTIPFAVAKQITDTVTDGITLISSWSSKILMQSAWKYANPNRDVADKVEYEQVVKENYSVQEQYALVELIAMMKGLAALMSSADSVLSPIIRQCVHNEVQTFIQSSLREMIRHASKKKRPVRSELLSLRTMAADWKDGKEPNDPAIFGKKETKGQGTVEIKIPSRQVGPSPTQLTLIRNVVFGFISHKQMGKRGLFSDKDFRDSHVKVLETFYERSFFFPYLFDYVNVIQECTDLSDLWFREFYLELSKALQFPIDMSLPWLITKKILEDNGGAGSTSMMEHLFYPLDIYNDAAQRSLHTLHQRFLYDELEAETNLVFEQLVVMATDMIYVHFKSQASSIQLDHSYKKQLEHCNAAESIKYAVPRSRFGVLLRQRHIQMLGRQVDMNVLISQRMMNKIRENIGFVVARFEANPLTGIVELEIELDNIRLVHSMLKEHLDLSPWENLLRDLSESVSLVSYHSRILSHIQDELYNDFFPNMNYNTYSNRFVLSPVTFVEGYKRPARRPVDPAMGHGSVHMNRAFANIFELSRNFFGTPHFLALVRVLTMQSVPVLLDDVTRTSALMVENILAPYVSELTQGLPPSQKLPIYDYGTKGGHGFFQLKLQDIVEYPELDSEVFQKFREYGNSVIFLLQMDHAIAQVDAQAFVQVVPFLGVTADSFADPNTPVAGDGVATPLVAAAQQMAEASHNGGYARVPSILDEMIDSAQRISKFYAPPRQAHSTFKLLIREFERGLDPVFEAWSGGDPEQGALMSVERSTEFYRLWSALQFIFCLPKATGDDHTQIQMFGDGLLWAGPILIHFLGQRLRFNTFDFSYHILNIEDAAEPKSTDESLVLFLKEARRTREINKRVFELLKCYAPVPPPQILLLHPVELDMSTASGSTGGSAHCPPTPPPHSPLPS